MDSVINEYVKYGTISADPSMYEFSYKLSDEILYNCNKYIDDKKMSRLILWMILVQKYIWAKKKFILCVPFINSLLVKIYKVADDINDISKILKIKSN